MATDWRGYFPRGVQDPSGPDGEPITTPTDRRLLWFLESELAIFGTTDHHRDLTAALRSYLNETCVHHWPRTFQGDETVPAHRQCLWCNHVDWLTEDGRAAEVTHVG